MHAAWAFDADKGFTHMRTMMRTLAVVLLASLMLFGGAAAQAHDELVSSDPAANATLRRHLPS